MRLLIPLLLLSACVVQYGPPPDGGAVPPVPQEPQDPPVDFDEVVERLDALLVSTEDVDQRDRLDAARGLARRMRDEEPRAQRIVLAYLQEVVTIEERTQPMEAPALYSGEATFSLDGPAIVEEELEAPDEPEPTAEAPPAPGSTEDVTVLLQQARDLQQAGELAQALSLLERCLGQPCFEAAEPQWIAARDAYVHQQREQAGVLFLRARDEADPVVRLQALTDIRQRLADLADRYPEAAQAEAVRRNVELVQRAVEEATAAAARPEPDAGAAPAAP